MLQKLKAKYKKKIKDDQELQLKIAKLFHKKNIVTVQRWVASDNPVLTIPSVIDIIRNHEGLPVDIELTENVEETKVA